MQEGRREERHEEQPVTREQLLHAFQKDSQEGKDYLLIKWRIQELEKRERAETPPQILETYLATAQTLMDIGLINDARESLEDIADMAERFDEPEYGDKALEILAKLPSVH